MGDFHPLSSLIGGRSARVAAPRVIGRVRAQAAAPPRLARSGPHSAPMRPAPAASSSGPLQNVMFVLIFAYLMEFAVIAISSATTWVLCLLVIF